MVAKLYDRAMSGLMLLCLIIAGAAVTCYAGPAFRWLAVATGPKYSPAGPSADSASDATAAVAGPRPIKVRRVPGELAPGVKAILERRKPAAVTVEPDRSDLMNDDDEDQFRTAERAAGKE